MSEPLSRSPPDEFLAIATDRWTEPFWTAAADHCLVAPRCGACGQFRMPPTPFCPNCLAQNIEWLELSGRGIVYSYTIVSRAIAPSMEKSIPYVPAVVSLPDADGIRLISNIVDARLSEIRVGAPVQLVWNDRPQGHAIPQFELVQGAA